MDVCCRQKVCERLVRTKVVELQSQLKQAAMTLIKQMDATYTAKMNEIGAARQSVQADVASIRRAIDAARTNMDMDGVNSDATLQSVLANLASTLFTVR